MSNLFKPTKEILVKLINDENKTSFDAKQFIFGPPEPRPDVTGYNTAIPYVLKDTDGKVLSDGTFDYNRINLKSLFFGFVPYCRFQDEVSLTDILTAVKKQFGLIIGENEIVDNDIDLTPNEKGDVVFVLEALNSVGYIGKVDLKLLIKPSVIAGALLTESGAYLTTEAGNPLIAFG